MDGDVTLRVQAAMAQHWVGDNDKFIASVDALEAFETRLGYEMPADFRYFQLNVRHAELNPRVSPYYLPLRATQVPYFGCGLEIMFDNDLSLLYVHDDSPEGWVHWLTQLVPCATDGDNNYLCLDFAFDSKSPPVVILQYDRGGTDEPYVHYVADSFVEMLEFEIVDEHGGYQTRDDRVSQRMVDWNTHRNKLLSIEAKPPFAQNADDINWPA